MFKILSPIFLFTTISVSGAIALFTSYVPAKSHLKPKLETQVEKPTSQWVEEQMKSMTLEQKLAQFFMVACNSNKGEAHIAEVESLVKQNEIGGVIFFQGDTENLTGAISRFQGQSKIPLFVAIDGEWGVGMRISDVERFPYHYTMGAADDTLLTRKINQMIAQECRDLGIHINFAPVADVNSNPANPVIGFRSFGEFPRLVSRHVSAAVKGMESQGVMTSIKHFPGHGDTDVDSHYDLPVVNNSYAQINAIDFPPFREGIKAGAGSVMVGHLNIPSLDPSGLPTTLSKKVIQDFLKSEFGFQGLVVSDALRMKAIADNYGKTEAVVMAFEAGVDILLIPESVSEAIVELKKRVESGKISSDEVDRRCRKVLQAKYDYIVKPKSYKKFTASEQLLAKRQVYEKALTVLKNDNSNLPIQSFNNKIALVSIGTHSEELKQSLAHIPTIDFYHAYSGSEAKANFAAKMKEYDLVITAIHTSSVISTKDFGMPKSSNDWFNALPADKKDVLVLLGNPLACRKYSQILNFESVLIAYENHEITSERVGQFLQGAFESKGKLPQSINEEYKLGMGLELNATGRIKDSQPEEVGLDPRKLDRIDSIAMDGIRQGAYPGCQIAVVVDDKLVYHKAFGHHTYEDKQEVKLSDLYDIASITKIAASTTALMHLDSKDQFTLHTTLENYLPELTKGTSYASVRLKDMLAHQAGFTPWIPFYTSTLSNGNLRSDLYHKTKSADYQLEVTPNLFLKNSYVDTMYKTILSTGLKAKSYKYSDVGYYFVKKIVEKQSGESFENYLRNEVYLPLGLGMCFNPLQYYSKNQIAPTEMDKIFRKELVHGTVHDQGAAMMGGVGGHAGLFSSARDLAQLMQLFLKKGKIAGKEYIESKVVEEYTGYQFAPSSRRGAGFDKPLVSGSGGPCYDGCSKSSYGHSGFTGTLVWTDPEYNLTYVFLSNRVYPDAENWKILKLGTRTEIQAVIYEALRARK